jgi:hypothetical protein
MEELGVTSAYVSEATQRPTTAISCTTPLLAGATGWLTWTNTDYDDLLDVEPYSHHPFQRHFTLIDKFHRPDAQAL